MTHSHRTPNHPHARPHPRWAGLTAVILVLSMGAGVGLGESAVAQGPIGAELTGTVSDLSGAPLPDVAITAKKPIAGSTWHYHETRTDATGKYTLSGLEPGTWNVSFQKDGYRSVHEAIEVGPNGSAIKDATLRSVTESTLRGTVMDAENGKPIQGAKIQVQTWGENGPLQRNTSSGEDGTYQISLFPQDNDVLITKNGYSTHQFWTHGQRGDLNRDARLWQVPPQSAVVEGQVVDKETGEGVQALVSLRPDWDQGHHDTSDADSPAIQPLPRYHQGNHNSTITDENGHFRMNAHPGHVVLEANRQGFLIARTPLELTEDRTHEADLMIERLPERSVTLDGKVTNAANGSAVAGASVSVQVPQSGDSQWTTTDQDGHWQVEVRPGYTLIEVSHWGRPIMYSAEGRSQAEPVHGDAEPASMEETQEAPAPEPGGAQTQDATRYYPALRATTTQADSSRSVNIELHPEREATTTIIGYVIDTDSGEGVRDARVHLQNHETGAWGQATTDEHGSFRFETHAGYHTLRMYSPGYLPAGVNTVAGDSGTHRVDIETAPGEWAQSGWWTPDQDRYGHDGPYPMPAPMPVDHAQSDGTHRESSMGMATDAPMESAMSSGPAGPSGDGGLRGSGGGLGPYQAQQQEQAPGPGVLLVLLLVHVALIGVLRKRSG